jgi:hypothetical protein
MGCWASLTEVAARALPQKEAEEKQQAKRLQDEAQQVLHMLEKSGILRRKVGCGT